MHANESADQPIVEAPTSRFIDEKLFKSRSITIFGEIDEKLARSVTEKLLALAAAGDEPITLYISSPGGHVESGDVVYDMIKFIKPEVRVVGTGWVASAATTIYLAAKKENRFSLPNTRFLVHQPSGGSRGRASDIKIQASRSSRCASASIDSLPTRQGSRWSELLGIRIGTTG